MNDSLSWTDYCIFHLCGGILEYRSGFHLMYSFSLATLTEGSSLAFKYNYIVTQCALKLI